MTDDETGEMRGVQRPIISRFGGDCARYEQPTDVKVQRCGQRWTRPNSTGVAS